MRRDLYRIAATCLVAMTALTSACGNFDITNPNNPNLDNLTSNPTRSQLTAAATGMFVSARGDAQGMIWVLGAMGREGAKLDGNNQPDYQEPFYGPLSPGGIGGAFWAGRYAAIRSINIYLQALGNTKALTAGEIAASKGVAKTLKALAMMTVIATHGTLGAPIDVDRPLTDPTKAPFVTQDSVYGYIIAQLDSAQAELAAAGGASFPFPMPPGLTGATGGIDFSTPAGFRSFNRALAAKALVFRGSLGGCASCFATALTVLNQSFLAPTGDLQAGAYFDFSNSSGDTGNNLSDPIGGTTYFALDSVLRAQAQHQPNGELDQRLLNKTVAATDTQRLGGIPIVGTTKFSVYLSASGAANPNTPIPIIRNEELILLRAEANIGTGNKAAAAADLDLIRARSGNLDASGLTAGSPTADFITELLYERRFSLLWEQGTTWIDARRYDRLASIPRVVASGNVPTQFPIPSQECASRGLPVPCSPLGK